MSKPLSSAIRLVAERIEKLSGSRRLNESATKVSLIDPVLAALQWDVSDVDEVQLVQATSARQPGRLRDVRRRSPKKFVEAKALGSKLDDQKWAPPLLHLKHYNSIADAVADLGRLEGGPVFSSFQRYLYNVSNAA